MGGEIPKRALASGLSEEEEYKKHWMNLNRLVRLGKVDESLEIVEKILVLLQDYEGSGNEAGEGAARVLELENELASLKVAEADLRNSLSTQMKELAGLIRQGLSRQLGRQIEIIGESEGQLQKLVNDHIKRKKEIESELLSFSQN